MTENLPTIPLPAHEVLTETVGGFAGTTQLPNVTAGYELRGEIARGGMGIVYRAFDRGMNRDVAIKVLQNKYAVNSHAAQRFLEEAQITGQLQHPGIPPVYVVSKFPDGRPYLAMKLIKGETLDELLKSNAPVNRLAVFEAIAQAVGYAHAHNVIHRDLKPSNIMVGAFGEVQVMDWGLAKVLSPSGSAPTNQRVDNLSETAALSVVRPARDSNSGSMTEYGSIVGTLARRSCRECWRSRQLALP
jgi:eukaryotic-like serine/threonine-protein kinase